MAKKRRRKKKSKAPSIIVVVLVVAAIAVFAPRLIHKCDSCGKIFFGTGYEPNVVADLLSDKEQIICRDCAEKQHALSGIVGKSVDEFRRPLF